MAGITSKFSAALDLRLVVAELLEQRDLLPRGLAHPVTFISMKDRPAELQGRVPGLNDLPELFNSDFIQFGAVKVTPKTYYQLMETKQDALLFPGGAKEALSGRRDYPLCWPDKVDFVRTAAKFNATIIPLSAVGMIDSVNVLAEPKEILETPFFGDRFEQLRQNMSMSAARYDEKGQDEVIGFPLALPKLPARNYFLFGRPVRTNRLDPKDRDACMKVYREVEAQVRRGLDDLVRARQHDPFGDFPKRLAFELFFGKQAPTFSIDELN